MIKTLPLKKNAFLFFLVSVILVLANTSNVKASMNTTREDQESSTTKLNEQTHTPSTSWLNQNLIQPLKASKLSDVYCNGATRRDSWGFYYPNGKKVTDSWGTYYPSGNKVFDSWGLYYPNGNKVKDNWGTYYPNGSKIFDNWGCYNQDGNSIDCTESFRSRVQIPDFGKVIVHVYPKMNKLGLFSFEYTEDRSTVIFEVDFESKVVTDVDMICE